MLSFKHYLIEYLTPKQSEKWSGVKMNKDAREHTDGLFGPGNDKIVEPLLNYDHDNYDHDKSEPHRKIEQHLGMQISPEHYKKGRIPDPKYPKRELRIGSLIKDPKLQSEFASDNTRAGSKTSGYYASIVRGHHVAGQTNSVPDEHHPKGHSWADHSCKNIETGSNKKYLKSEIKEGSVVVRVHHPETHEEIYRATLHPHHDEHGNRVYALNSEYGIKHPSFTAHARDVARRLSGEYKPGIFSINDHVYNDISTTSILHPAATTKHIHDALNHKSVHVRMAAINHPNATVEHIHKALEDKNAEVRQAAIRHPNVTAEHIHKALNDKNADVRYAALMAKNVNSDHLDKAITDRNYDVRQAALEHPNFTSKNIDTALKHKNVDVRTDAIEHKNASAENISTALKDKNEHVKISAIRHENANEEHISTALKDKSINVRISAAEHPKATVKHLHQALKDKEPMVRQAALNHPNIKREHLEPLLNDQNNVIKNLARKKLRQLNK